MNPLFSIGKCPICGGGLCGVRICGLTSEHPHGLIVCDECEATWLRPDLTTRHLYPNSCDARCPKCSAELYGSDSRWATELDLAQLGWEQSIDPSLSFSSNL
jgi:hypothetical protein